MPTQKECIKKRVCFDNSLDFLKQFAFKKEPKCCLPDLTRMFDCDCGSNDSYCVMCGRYLACQLCA